MGTVGPPGRSSATVASSTSLVASVTVAVTWRTESRRHPPASAQLAATPVTTGATASAQHTFPSPVCAQYCPAGQSALAEHPPRSSTELHARPRAAITTMTKVRSIASS